MLQRRTFLARSCRAALAVSLLPTRGHSQEDAARSSAAKLSPTTIEYLDRRIPELLAETKVPGLGIAVVENGMLAWRGSYGLADVETGARIRDDTLFQAGSVSKTVFAYAVMKLCERGVLSLDEPLTKYSSFRPLEDPRVDAITARRVLCHTTGLPNFRSATKPLSFAFAPGERWLYSGEAYWYLQSVVTELTGHVDGEHCSTFEADLRVCATDIGDYLKKNVLAPFGMTSSGYVWNAEFEAKAAQGHDETGRLQKPRRRASAVEAARYAAIGGLHTTPTEYAKFLLEVIDPKPQDAYRLGRASRDEMIRPQVKVDASSSWALGWQVYQSAAGDLLSHSGDNPGFKAFVVASVPRKSGWVILINGDNAGPIIRALVDDKCPLNELFATR